MSSVTGASNLDLSVFDGIERVVADPLHFKQKLAIGEDAYASLRTVNRLRELWDILGTAGTGAAIAKSGVVATTFFAPSGLLGLLGIGTAVTPIGWVAFAALASGGACYGMYRLLGNSKANRVIEIPKFLNTPLDTLGLALFDLIAPLALRLAAVDGSVEPEERQALIKHLVMEWGLDSDFVPRAIDSIEPKVMQSSIDDLASELSDFLHANPDCNHKEIAAELVRFLQCMLESGGVLSKGESDALATVESVLTTARPSEMVKAWSTAKERAGTVWVQLKQGAARGAVFLGDGVDTLKTKLPKLGRVDRGRG